MKTPLFDLHPEDAANLPGLPPWKAHADAAVKRLIDHLAEHPEEIPDYLNAMPRAPRKPTTPAISETRRRAARARWDAPREKSTRVTITLPPDVAKKLHAAADASHRPISHLVAKCVTNALPTILVDALAENLED